MLLEHVIYTLIPCVIIGMFYLNRTCDNPVWLILFSTLIPDIDFIIQTLQLGVLKFPFTLSIQHGTFHTIFFGYVVSVLVGLVICNYTKIKFLDASLCVGIGFVSHLLEDAFVYSPSYAFFAPFSSTVWDTAVIPATNNIHIGTMLLGSTNVLVFGLLLLLLAIVYRSCIQGVGWLKKYDFSPVFIDVFSNVRTFNIAKISLIILEFKNRNF